MRKIKDFQLFDQEPVVMGNRIKPVIPFNEFKKEEIHQSIARRFEQQVERYPGNIAVKTINKVLTYSRLNSTANQIAHAILLSGEKEGECGAALLFEHDADARDTGGIKSREILYPHGPYLPN